MFLKKGKYGHRHAHEEIHWEDKGRDSQAKGMPKTAANPPEACNRLLLTILKGNHFDLRRLDSRTETACLGCLSTPSPWYSVMATSAKEYAPVAEGSALTYRAASSVGEGGAGVLPGDRLSPGSAVAINCVQCQAQHLP